ncbi:MAG: tocopherol cyclase family protein [Bacteroidota bacterium]
MLLKNKLKALFKAEQFQGWGKTERYFEGWYYKVLNKNEDQAFAFIPGVAMDENGKKQAFIQVLDGKNRTAAYHRFDFKEFRPKAGKFRVVIGNNRFQNNQILLDLPNIRGKLTFHQQVPWSDSGYSSNIMRTFSFLPFVQWCQGILSMNHTIKGWLQINGERVDFTGGKGYLEKDWGRSFPDSHLWLQTNHFSVEGVSLKTSVAKIPCMGTSFVGFTAGVWLVDRLIEFSPFNLTKLRKSYADEKKVELVMENNRHCLQILAKRETAVELASPIVGFLDGRVEESMNAKIEVQLIDKKFRRVLLADVGRNAGVEVAGNVRDITVV